ncbi:MAG TPA: hypothetical protein PK156_50960, partial [Polyangium sp.]|nr:hypothetical protein [Polyangium sp.]
MRVANVANGGQGGGSASASSGGVTAGGGVFDDGGIDTVDADVIEPCTGQGTWRSIVATNEPSCREYFTT